MTGRIHAPPRRGGNGSAGAGTPRRPPAALPRLPAALLLAALVPAAASAQSRPVALTHVRLIDGTGVAPVEEATVVMQHGRIVAAGRGVAVPRGARVLDRRGDSVLPALISDHSHVGQVGGTDTAPRNYTRATIAAELAQYRRYGVTTVTALGNNRPLFAALRAEAHAGRLPADLFGAIQGIGVPGGAPPFDAAADQLFRPATPQAARAAVARMAAQGTDLVKIWVDDFDGTLPVKMAPAMVRAVVAAAHRHGLRVAAHIHDLADAQMVVAAGVDIIAHGVRDRPVTPAFVAAMKARGVWYVATLQLDEATVAWADRAPWTRTPFARAGLSAAQRAQVDDPGWAEKTRSGAEAARARAALATNLANLKVLYDAGVSIGFGTDSGANAQRVPGVAEHRELALSVAAGLTPMQAIVLATRNAAALLRRDDRGTIAAGRRADLLVVRGDPARDIAALDRIVETWRDGAALPGPLPLAR